jgi:hypothetical protein
MSYAIGTNISTIKTNLSKENALTRIRQLWNNMIIENLAFCVKDSSGNQSYSGVFSNADKAFVDIDEMIDGVFDYSFKGDDIPYFPSKTVSIKNDGTVEIYFSTESNDCHGAELTDYFYFAIQHTYGTESHYTRRSECEYPGGHDIVVGNVYNNGKHEVIYSNA